MVVAAFIFALAIWILPRPASAISIGDSIRANVNLNIRASATTSGTLLGTAPSGSTGVVLAGPTSANGWIWWRIDWDNSSLSTGWSVDDLTVVTSVPASPTTLYAFGGASAIGLGWADNSNNETGFKLERKVGSGSWSLYKTLGQNEAGYSDTSVSAGTTYYYRVYAYNSNGLSTHYTNEAFAALTVTIPSAPGPLETQSFSDRVELGWTDNSTNETGFKIERRTGSGSYSQIATTGSNSDSSDYYTDNTTAPRTTYTYRVRAYNSAGNSGYSNEATNTTPGGPPGAFTLSNDPAVWDTSIPGPKVQLNWTTSTDVGNYALYRNGSVYVAGIAGTSYLNSANLTGGATYTYFVRASNADGTRDSNTITVAMPSAPVTIPNAPGYMEGQAFSDRIELGWTDNSTNESGFKIERRTGSGSYTQIATTGANSSNSAYYTDNTTSPQTTYTYRVRAYNSAGNSGYTPEVTITTLGSSPGSFTLSNQAPVWDTAYPAGPAVQLNWTTSSNATSYEVYRNGTKIYPTSGNFTGTSFRNETGLTTGQTYSYYILAKNSVGTRQSNTINVGPMPGATVSTPGTFVLSYDPPTWDSSASGPKVTLRWTNSQTAVVYTLYRNGAIVPITGGAVSPHSDSSGLAGGGTYSYFIRAWNAQGTTDSNTVTVTMPTGTAGTSTTSDVRASQRAGTTLVDIYYTILGQTTTTTVSLQGSSNGGSSYGLPTNSLSGDVGSGVTSGSNRHIVWNAGHDWNNQVSTTVKFRVSISGTSSTSSSITVDTRTGGDLTVTGRVINAQTNLPVAGASVTLAGLSTTSASNGSFTLVNVNMAGGNTLITSASGLIQQTKTVTAAAGVKSVNVGDIALAPNTDKPVVEWVKPDLAGLFLYGWNTSTTLRMRVNWNGNTPGQVLVYGKDQLRATLTGAGPEYSTLMPIDSWFVAAGIPGTNHVRVVARTSGASPKEGEKRIDIAVLPIPQAFAAFYVPGNQSVENYILKLKVKFPAPAIKKTVNLDVIGEFGGTLQGEGELEYNIRTGEWKVTVGGAGSAAKIIMGSYSADLGIAATGKGTATLANGLTFSDLTLAPSFGLSGEFRLGAWGIPDLAGPGLSSFLTQYKYLRPFIDNVVIVAMVKPSFEGSAELALLPSFNFNHFELTGKAALEGFWEPKVMGAKARFTLGGEPSISFQYPGDFFKKVGFKAYFSIMGRAFGHEFTPFEAVFVDYSFASAPGRRLTQEWHDTGNGYVIEAVGNASMESRPMERPWRSTGIETFVADQASDELDSFNRMGQAASPGAVYAPAGGPGRRITSDPGLPAQTALPLLTNVFPDAEPALAGRAASLMLLYARDTGAANPFQFTEIAWTRYDGTAWTTPAALAPAANGQFAPKVVIDGNGDAIAVWEQINDPAFSDGSLEQLASRMEIMWSRWNSATNTWTTPIPITSNTILDHDPRLAGTLPDGDLLLTWIRNAGNKLAGEGTIGAVTNNEVMVARWDSTTGAWGAASTLVPNLTGDTCHSLAVGGNNAVFMWGQDVDGNLANTTDTELFYRMMDASSIWGATTRLTNDAIPDINARVLLDSSGDVFTVWKRGGDLVMQRDLAGIPLVLRADSGSVGATDFTLALGPNGNLLVIWQDMSENGSDAHYRVFDPASNTWGLDTLLANDRDLERSFAPVWDASGNLVLAYLNVEIINQTKTVTIAGGGDVTVDGVPQPGQVDLLLARRAIVKDLALSANGLTAEGTNYLPGDTITLKAKIKNTGNVAVENVAVSFYNGDPSSSGALIQTVTLPGWLKAYDEACATINWTIPEPAVARTIFALLDPSGIITEFDESNNVLFLPLDGVDLQLEYVSGNVLPDGSTQVVAKVKSLSAPESPVTTLKLFRRDATSPLFEVNVSQLAPGDSVEIPLNLPAGSHAEGEYAYRLILDEAALSGDVDPSNNEVLFSLNLWIDKDGDGLPNQWEAANGLSDSNPDDGGFDADGDGFTNRQEYLAGTNPRDSSSMLRIGEIAQRSLAQGGGIAISWNSAAGRIYNLERSYDLASWVVIGRNVTATTPLNTVVDHAVAPFGKAFYRLIVLETTDAYNYAPMARTIAFKAERRETEGSMNATLSWDSEIGRTYAVERSTDLTNWEVIAEKIPSTAPRNTYIDRAPLSQTKAFYRVLER